jgi:hypothetical protein
MRNRLLRPRISLLVAALHPIQPLTIIFCSIDARVMPITIRIA